MDIVKRRTQLEWELDRRRAELARLEQELAEREEALSRFEAELEAFKARYYQALAAPLAEYYELEAQIAEKEAAVRPHDTARRNKAQRARARAEGADRPAPPSPVEPKARPQDALRQVYRTLTKLAHPDLAPDAEERKRRESVMIEANAAYAEGDFGTLTYLLGHWETQAAAPEADDLEAALERVMRQIAQVAERLEGPMRELEAAEKSEFAALMRRAASYEAEGRDLFEKLVGEVEAANREARKRITALERRLSK